MEESKRHRIRQAKVRDHEHPFRGLANILVVIVPIHEVTRRADGCVSASLAEGLPPKLNKTVN